MGMDWLDEREERLEELHDRACAASLKMGRRALEALERCDVDGWLRLDARNRALLARSLRLWHAVLECYAAQEVLGA